MNGWTPNFSEILNSLRTSTDKILISLRSISPIFTGKTYTLKQFNTNKNPCEDPPGLKLGPKPRDWTDLYISYMVFYFGYVNNYELIININNSYQFISHNYVPWYVPMAHFPCMKFSSFHQLGIDPPAIPAMRFRVSVLSTSGAPTGRS